MSTAISGGLIFPSAPDDAQDWQRRTRANLSLTHEYYFAPLDTPMPEQESTFVVTAGDGPEEVSILTANTRTALRPVGSVRAVLRTFDAWAERPFVRVAFQLHDEFGVPRIVSEGLNVSMKMTSLSLIHI